MAEPEKRFESHQDPFILSNGVGIPCVGFGTWRIPPGQDTVNAVSEAIRLGYRHFDTAKVYNNEESVGVAVRNSNVQREQIFVTTKLWNENKTRSSVLEAFETSMTNLGLEYLDLYLLHWPAVEKTDGENWRAVNIEKWRALESLYKDGRIRAIGVSNFLPHHLQALMDEAEIVPMVNQLEIHLGFPQKETVDFCLAHDIRPQAWSPIARGLVLGESTLISIAEKLRRTPAQICLRWILQNGVIPLPRSQKPERMAENAAIFDFTISASDMEALDALPPCGGSCSNPDERTED